MNPIFRKLFLLRKVFLIRSRFHHYSQFAEDISISRLFPKSYRGFFVDVGCFHPKKFNNTYYLYEKGWRGVNIDIDPIKIEAFQISRPDDVNIACAVSIHDGETDFYSHGFYALSTSLECEFNGSKEKYKKKRTRCLKLDSLLKQTRYRNRQIDLLSIDAEGHDLEVLKSLDFEIYNPKIIAIESHQRLYKNFRKTNLCQYLKNQGYSLAGWCGLTFIMAKE